MATHDSTLTAPEQLIADLQLQLAKSKAERDDAMEQQTDFELANALPSQPKCLSFADMIGNRSTE